jgi:hypothetical protein
MSPFYKSQESLVGFACDASLKITFETLPVPGILFIFGIVGVCYVPS